MRLINIFSIYLIVFVFIINVVTAVPPFIQESDPTSGAIIEAPIKSSIQQGEDWMFHIHVYNATDGTRLTNETVVCTIHVYSPLTGEHLIEDNMSFDSNGIDFEYTVLGDNFTTVGQYSVLFDCQDTSIGGFLEYPFYVTLSGEEFEIPESIAYLSFLLFLSMLMGSLYVLQKSINFEKWNNKIISKYENKNYVKLVFSSIGYNLMKNAFVIYYLIGLAALVIITDFAYMASIVSITELMPSVLAIYSVGIIIVGIYFFGYVQEWLMNLLNQIRDMDWGMK